ncbi:chemotaxis protein CheB [Chitinophaga filiformis]|uniref:protein-glutamate methylesterase n=1 Tax=Chitinophaga filiformis TaxID=104663 RepID=A0A1G7YW06_CHIFI|nr:chemotaxis protein CheB [Chitinophaga filiformis]SDH00456.1 CheB methylesterase [Chitinophaga filiformis]
MKIASQRPLFCIGIGCSAGGLEPACEFFQQVVEKTGAAFVVIPHLGIEHKSKFSSILERYTHMPVHRVERDIKLETDHVYVLAEDRMMMVEDGYLKVRRRYTREIINKSIDIFFKSMAKAYRENGIGVILSGMGTDGIEGIKVIEDHHGLVIVQDPDTTDFNILPQSAINKDDPHAILPPADIARFLLRHLKIDNSLKLR